MKCHFRSCQPSVIHILKAKIGADWIEPHPSSPVEAMPPSPIGEGHPSALRMATGAGNEMMCPTDMMLPVAMMRPVAVMLPTAREIHCVCEI